MLVGGARSRRAPEGFGMNRGDCCCLSCLSNLVAPAHFRRRCFRRCYAGRERTTRLPRLDEVQIELSDALSFRPRRSDAQRVPALRSVKRISMPLRSTTTTSCRINATCPSHRSTRSVPRLPSSIRSLAEQDQCSFRRRAAKDYIVDRCTSALCGDFDADALVRGGPT